MGRGGGIARRARCVPAAAVVEVAAGSASLAEGEGSGHGSERPSGPTSVAGCAPTGPQCSHRRELAGRGRSFSPSPSLTRPSLSPWIPPPATPFRPSVCPRTSLPSGCVSAPSRLPLVGVRSTPAPRSVRPAVLGPPSQLFSGFSVSAPRPSVFFVSGLPRFPCGPPQSRSASGTPRQPPWWSLLPSLTVLSCFRPLPLFCLSVSGCSLPQLPRSPLSWVIHPALLLHLSSLTPMCQ